MATNTKALPAQILGVKRTVTEAQARAWIGKSQADLVRAMIGAMYLVERGKAKSVRALAESWGISKSTVSRLQQAAAVVWRVGGEATEADAVVAVALANTAANGLGGVGKFLDSDANGKALAKSLPGALESAREARVERDAKPSSKSGAKSGKVTSTGPRTNKGRGTLVEQTLAAITGKVDSDQALTILAHAVRVALASCDGQAIADTLAGALTDDQIGAVVTAAETARAA